MKTDRYLLNAGTSRAALRVAAFAAVALFAAGCSTLGQGGSKAQGTTSSESGSVPFTDRISNLFGGSSKPAETAPAAAATPAATTAADIDCPRMDIRAGASTLLVNAGTGDADAMSLRYQGTFVRAARECRVQNGQLSIKIGVEGRLVIGPAGAEGPVTVPLRMALIRETLDNSTPIWSKLYMVGVTIPPQSSSVPFTEISDDLTIPLPDAAALEQMVIYIGFDPSGAAAEPRKRAPKAAAKKRRAG
jgi:hypothetical protein